MVFDVVKNAGPFPTPLPSVRVLALPCFDFKTSSGKFCRILSQFFPNLEEFNIFSYYDHELKKHVVRFAKLVYHLNMFAKLPKYEFEVYKNLVDSPIKIFKN